MSDSEIFSIRLDSFNYDYRQEAVTPANVKIIKSIGEYGQDTLKRLYGWVCSSVRYANSMQRSCTELLNGSIFIICVPDGTIMVRCCVKDQYNVSLPGIFLRKGIGEKMGWRLARWQLLVAVAGGVFSLGSYSLSMDALSEKSNSASLDKAYLEKLFAFGLRIMQEPLPVNYAMTDFPKEKLPFDFGENIAGMMNDYPPEERTLQINTSMKNLGPDHNCWKIRFSEKLHLNVFRIVFITKREFLKDKEEEFKCFDRELRRQKLSQLKLQLSDKGDYLWCVRVGFSTYDGLYSEFLPQELSAKVSKGLSDAASVLAFAWSVERNALAFFKERTRLAEEKAREDIEKSERKEREKEEKLLEKQKFKAQKKYKKQIRPISESESPFAQDDGELRPPAKASSKKAEEAPSAIEGFMSKLFGRNSKN